MRRDVLVRDPRADDARSIAEIHIDRWRWGYRDLVAVPGTQRPTLRHKDLALTSLAWQTA
jgi:hypothetical protein